MDKSYLSSKAVYVALLAGVSLTAGGIIYSYIARKRLSDSAKLQSTTHPKSAIKEKLKLLLRRDNVFCSDIDYVEELIDNLIKDGANQVQVIADFDRTMTPLTHNDTPVPSCHGVVEHCPRLPQWFSDKLTKIKEYYLAIEIDPELTREEKLPFMEEWWNKAHDLLLSCSITRKDIVEAVECSNLYMRKKSEEVLELLHTMEIPLLVFSAGVGDVIEQMFIQRYKLYDNIHIIANWMEFNHEGALIGFKGENIHVFNKDAHALKNASYFDNLQHRHNVILLGDSLGDLDIAHGLVNHENLLTIGYLNHHVEASLPQYKAKYDIVLADEEGLELLQSLLENVTAT